VNIVRVLENCEQRAGFQYGWADFAPIGLMISRTGTVEAITGYPLGTTLDQVSAMLIRAAGRHRERIAALGIACSAWSSVSAVQDMIAPGLAEDRQRARLVAAVDRKFLVHLLSNINGNVSYTTDPSPYGGVGPVLTGAMHRLLTKHEPQPRVLGRLP